MRLRYPFYAICLYAAFQCGQVYKAHTIEAAYISGLPAVSVEYRTVGKMADADAARIVNHFYSVED
jgi:hypothetical protein